MIDLAELRAGACVRRTWTAGSCSPSTVSIRWPTGCSGSPGMNTRRLFVLLPREGEPVAVAHKIELQGLENFPGRVMPYARWSELHAALGHAGRGQDPGAWRSPPETRCPISTGCLMGWSSCSESGGEGRAFRRRWSPALRPDGASRSSADHRAAAEILADGGAEHFAAGGAGDRQRLTEIGACRPG